MQGPFDVPAPAMQRGEFPPPSRKFLQKARAARPLLLFWVMHHFDTIGDQAVWNLIVLLMYQRLKVTPVAVMMWAWAVATAPTIQRNIFSRVHDTLWEWVQNDYDIEMVSHPHRWKRSLFLQPVVKTLRYVQRTLVQLNILEETWTPLSRFPLTPMCCQCGSQTHEECMWCTSFVCQRCTTANMRMRDPEIRCNEWAHD